MVVHKPAGMAVHQGLGMDPVEVRFLLQDLRDQLGVHLYPVHRLDRPTSGLVVLAFDSLTAADLALQFRHGQVHKSYQAIVRGWMPEPYGLTEIPLRHETREEMLLCKTRWNEMARCEVGIPFGDFPQARFARLQLDPGTGRYHQLRRHLNHLGHPIAGDTTHGDRHTNHWLQKHFGWWRLLLACTDLHFLHPRTGVWVRIEDAPDRGLDFYWRVLARI